MKLRDIAMMALGATWLFGTLAALSFAGLIMSCLVSLAKPHGYVFDFPRCVMHLEAYIIIGAITGAISFALRGERSRPSEAVARHRYIRWWQRQLGGL